MTNNWKSYKFNSLKNSYIKILEKKINNYNNLKTKKKKLNKIQIIINFKYYI